MNDAQIAEASALFRKRLQEVMKANKLVTQEQLATYLGISRSTMRYYLRLDDPALPTTETLQKVREKIPALTDDEVTAIEKAYSRRTALTRSQGGRKRGSKDRSRRSRSHVPLNTPARAVPTTSMVAEDANIGRLCRQLMHSIFSMQALVGNGAAAKGQSPSELLLTQAQHRYQIGDMPAILTADNFESIDVGSWSPDQLELFVNYSNLVLEESRKCLVVLTQLNPNDVREELLKRLARNADLLWRTYKAASSVAPIEYVKDIDLAKMCENI